MSHDLRTEGEILAQFNDSQRLAIVNLAKEILEDSNDDRVRIRSVCMVVRQRRKNVGLDPFTILAIVRVIYTLWKLWQAVKIDESEFEKLASECTDET